MKKVLIAALLPVLFFACAKEEVTNPVFRDPTCADTTDEGMFEKFTQPESVEFLRYFKVIPDTEFKWVVRYQHINSRILYNRSVDYNPFITYRVNKPAKIFAFLPFPNQPEQYYSWVVNAPDTSIDYQVNLYHLRAQSPQLQTGCYRIYYVVSDVDTGTVYTKGHYDLEIKNQ
ncbi:MAG TPA: hypothetical protein PL009_06255 [Flavipsychrobacter sp.]|nr:hypothetical protein [Flavipsychrobacter sp.]